LTNFGFLESFESRILLRTREPALYDVPHLRFVLTTVYSCGTKHRLVIGGRTVPRIGVTGHSNLTDATEKLVYEVLENLLEHLSGKLTGVSCLARGADQLFAQVVLDVGGSLEVVLPASDYRTKIKPENVDHYDALLTAAESVHVMPFDTSRREAYMAASEYLLSTVDEVIAVWDGGPSGGLGGTADVVAAARQRGLTVHVVWPSGAARE
jgi:hypothetical protein